ncbi:methyltransferase [Nocardia mexicana]|uniref:Methyltransferase family protein n=1 Tax=Nocardia mexicana TaxID=279262 RepID=A0A370H7P5_9NOCA|nr:methyltransferase [Nocardia mexicana]RDI52705.1 methyltransferase family protein [Nocardia mexicana]
MTSVVDALRQHPWVGSASWNTDRTAIVVRPDAAATAVRPVPGALLREHLAHWQHVYEFVYAAAADRHGDDLDLSGWRASDTGAPFPREHMLEWIEHAVGLVLRSDPGIVLEIGCGSGLLAHRVHTRTRGYVGLDVAEPVVARLREQRLPGVRVLRAAAHEITSEAVAAAVRDIDAGPAAPDCVVLNSVTQCFPDERYLSAVISDALDLVAAGGTVVVGDIRNLGTAPDYARWLESARAPGRTDAEVARRAHDRLAAEEELLCDPRVFARIARQHRREVRTTAYAKPFRADTELTRYRYDIVYTVDTPAPPPAEAVDWADLSGPPAERLRELGDERHTLVTGIPNALLDGQARGAVTPADLAAAAPRGWAVLLDSADARRLAVGLPDRQANSAALDGSTSRPVCNDPFDRFVRQRLPEVLIDHLDTRAATPIPRIVVVEEPTTP